MSFICGNFNNQEEDDFEVLWPFPTTPPRKTTRRHSFCSRSNKENKNPYSNRGLDKFEALLADLEDKRQKIFTQKGSEDISLVRFVYSNSNDVKPIVVKLKEKKQHDKDHKLSLENAMTALLPKSDSQALDDQKNLNIEGTTAFGNNSTNETEPQRAKTSSWSITRRLAEWWKPSYYLPSFVILILVFLALFGRSFAILCTSIGWYLIPTVNETLENSKRPKKKEYSRKLSEKITSPRSVLSGRTNKQGHRKSF